MFHAWQFDLKGNCVYISREKEGYQDRLCKENVGLRRLRCEVKFGGFVWVNLDDNPVPLEEWGGKPFECLRKSLEAEPLEVFHYHKAIVHTNYKLWHDTNSEFYHDFMHYHNRVTGFNDAYFARKNEAFEHGHVVVGTFEVNYDKYEGFESRAALSFPHLPPNQWYMIDLFPGMNFNLRGSALRCDVVTPLGPDKMMIEFSGLGLKSDTAEERADADQPSQLDLGAVRPQPARGSARRHRSGHNDAAGLGAAPHPAWPPREPDHSRRERHAPLLRRVGQVDEPAAEQSGAAVSRRLPPRIGSADRRPSDRERRLQVRRDATLEDDKAMGPMAADVAKHSCAIRSIARRCCWTISSGSSGSISATTASTTRSSRSAPRSTAT